MALLQFNIPFSAVALAAGVARTVVGFKAPANQAVLLRELFLSADGDTSTDTPMLVEFGRCTFATNGIGTNSTQIAAGSIPKIDPGRVETIQTTVAHSWTAGNEPTVITVAQPHYIPVFNGTFYYPGTYDSRFIVPGGGGFVLRLTSPMVQNVTGWLRCEE